MWQSNNDQSLEIEYQHKKCKTYLLYLEDNISDHFEPGQEHFTTILNKIFQSYNDL